MMFGKPYKPDGDDDNEYHSYFDGPEAQLNRAAWEAEQRVVRGIDTFLASLRPEDAFRALFTHAERVTYNLKHHRKFRG